MTVGEKIRFYREMRGMTQATLAQYASISLSTLRKYEIGNRNPKLDQLQKIANGLQISVHALTDIQIQSVDEIAPYLFAIAKVGDIAFHGDKDVDGKYDSDTLMFSFKNPILKSFMKEWADKKEVLDKLRADAQNSPDEQAKEYLLNRANEIEKEIELRLADSQIIIDKK